MKRQAPGVVCVTHREYLGDINPSSTFTVTEFPLNPGMQQTFPWLSQIASSYEEYYFKYLTFHYRSMSSSSILSVGGSNTSLGTVILSTEYNAVLPKFTTKNQMENHQFAASIKPSQNVSHRIQTHPQHTPLNKLFIRNSPPELNTDKRLYDLGNFQIATQGMQQVADDTTNYSIGELWVSYSICLMKPKISDTPLSGMDRFDLEFTDGVSSTLVTNENPFTSVSGGVVRRNGSSGFIKPLKTAGIIDFENYLDSGFYMFTYTLFGTVSATTWATGTPVFNQFKRCRFIKFYPEDNVGFDYAEAPEASAATNNHIIVWIIQITGPAVNENDPASFHFKYTDNWACDASTFSLTVQIAPPQLLDGFPID